MALMATMPIWPTNRFLAFVRTRTASTITITRLPELTKRLKNLMFHERKRHGDDQLEVFHDVFYDVLELYASSDA